MSSWKHVALGDVAEVSSGDGAPQEESAFGQAGIPFIRAGSLVPLLKGTTEGQLELIPESESTKRRMRIYPPHTVVFAKSGMSCTKGLVYELKGHAHVVCHLAALECGSSLNPRFLLRWFEVNSPSRLIANESYPSIKISDIRQEKIPLPPLAEQKRIAAILDAADELRTKRREALAQLDALLQSTFLTLFGGCDRPPVSLSKPTFGTTANFVPLSTVATMATGHTPDRSRSEYWNGAIPWISLTEIRDFNGRIATETRENVSEQGIKNSSSVKLPKGTVCFSRTASVGFVTVMGKEMSTSQDFVNWVCGPKLNPIYLMWCLIFSRDYLLSKSAGSIHKTIYHRHTERFQIYLPPLPLQQKFAAIVESIERQKAAQRAHLAELDALFAALQHRAFRGEL